MLRDFATPVGITTKSVLIQRDVDLIKQLLQVADVRVNFSIGSMDEAVWRTTEPGTLRPLQRMEVMQALVEAGVPAGKLMAPIIPMLSDSEERMEAVISSAVEHKAQFLAPIVLHLWPGSREWFMPFLREAHPHLLPEYWRFYRGSYAPRRYTEEVAAMMDVLRRRWRQQRPSAAAAARPSPARYMKRPGYRTGRRTIVSARLGPVEMIAAGTPSRSSSRCTYARALAGSCSASVRPAVFPSQPGSTS